MTGQSFNHAQIPIQFFFTKLVGTRIICLTSFEWIYDYVNAENAYTEQYICTIYNVQRQLLRIPLLAATKFLCSLL